MQTFAPHHYMYSMYFIVMYIRTGDNGEFEMYSILAHR